MCGIGYVFYACCSRRRRFIKEHAYDFGFCEEVQVRVGGGLKQRVDVAVSCVLAMTGGGNEAVPSLSQR